MNLTGYNKVPLSGYVIEPAEAMGFWVRIRVGDHILSFLLPDMHASTQLVRQLEEAAQIVLVEEKVSK